MFGKIGGGRVHEFHELGIGAVGFVDDRGLARALFGKARGAGIGNLDLYRPQPLRPEGGSTLFRALLDAGAVACLPVGPLRYM